MEPVYSPRLPCSSSSMISMARYLGAPVMDPPGKAAFSRSVTSIPSASCPWMLDTRWNTVA